MRYIPQLAGRVAGAAIEVLGREFVQEESALPVFFFFFFFFFFVLFCFVFFFGGGGVCFVLFFSHTVYIYTPFTF